MKIREIMSPDVKCAQPGDTIAAAAELMSLLDVGAVPVCDNGRLTGMLTDRDLAVRGVAEGRDPNTTPVREVMSEGIFYLFDDQSLEEASHLMEVAQLRRVPVLNRQKDLVGIVSLGDVATHARPEVGGHALQEISQPASAQ